MTELAAESAPERVTCPFCGLCCDDLAVSGGEVDARGCPLAAEGFALDPAGVVAVAGGSPVDLDHAIAHAAGILRGSTVPLIAGLETDIDGVRAALRLAQKIGAGVDHAHSDAAFRELGVAQRTGILRTSIGEVRARCDVLVVAGPDPARSLPRLFERLRCKGLRRVVFLCGEPEPSTTAHLMGTEITILDAPADQLMRIATGLRTLATAKASVGAVTDGAALQEIADHMRAARYGVITWCNELLDFAHADLAVSALCDLARMLNRKTRFATLPLSASSSVMGAAQVSIWRTGYPLRLEFINGSVRHDPRLLGWRAQLERSDALLWIGALGAAPPDFAGPAICLTNGNPANLRGAAVAIGVGRPGVDHAGYLMGADPALAARLGAVRASNRPSADAVLERILGAIEDAS